MKKNTSFLVYTIRFNETVHRRWCLDKSVDQTENGFIGRGFVNH